MWIWQPLVGVASLSFLAWGAWYVSTRDLHAVETDEEWVERQW